MFEIEVYQCYEIVILDATEVLEEGRKRAKELEAKQYRTEKCEDGKWRTI